ncbi:RNA-binding S4 domain-containing protein [Saccharopolyspora sp. K220]|uniref:RNA-binding S4 domain-containing protein n=1 Tax=Saccharopolyspora soli TaxID=2926618 RepID=UPI001F583ACA|nr:RNA-binding S4 domain-containing protein [Saccharopolyspora soli]MCI2421251.1 RNA-binding S4 domain-containing protein [Saccharopolyspora soli]
MREVEIRDDMIRLGQLLKLAGLVEHGADAKALLEEGRVEVNGAVETRRGKQLTPGDEITLGNETVRVVGLPHDRA